MHKLLYCDICEYKCQDLTSLNVHKFNEHKNIDTPTIDNSHSNVTAEVEGNFSCTQCSYRTQITYDYMGHASYAHSNQQSLICDKCDYQTQKDDEFISHLTLIHHKKIIAPWD